MSFPDARNALRIQDAQVQIEGKLFEVMRTHTLTVAELLQILVLIMSNQLRILVRLDYKQE